jgi:hypothetical protein
LEYDQYMATVAVAANVQQQNLWIM